MKYLAFLILAALVVGCNGCSQKSTGTSYNSNDTAAVKSFEPNVGSVCQDTSTDEQSYTQLVDSVGEIKMGEYKEEVKVEYAMKDEQEQQLAEKIEMPKLKAVNANIVDETLGLEADSHKGIIAYSVPDTMTVGVDYSIKVRITKEKGQKVKQEIIIGDQHIAINDTTVHSTITFDSIRVENIMSAIMLSADSAFNIRLLSTELQNIEDHGYTEWEWLINPQRSGRHPLKLIIKVKIRSKGVFKDIVVFEKSINTMSDYVYSTKRFVTKNWHYLMSSVIIPFAGWWWKRRQDKKKGGTAPPDTTPSP